ncbi:MAG: hypothetical protein JJE39_00970 [Vicinamibacteria bacterium]|nr:hypothetical protein [Vicinamibacteria bacterium]
MNRIAIIGVAFVLMLDSVSTLAQERPRDIWTDEAIRELIREVRLLRTAVERQASAAARVQLLVSRMTLQDQRVSRARALVDQHAQRISALTSEIGQIRSFLSTDPDSDAPVDTTRRREAERERKLLREQLAQQEAELADLESKKEQAALDFETERTKYNELEGQMTQLNEDLSHNRL